MAPKAQARGAEDARRARLHFDIAESLQTIRHNRNARQQRDHRPFGSIESTDGLAQVHQPPALSVNWTTIAREAANLLTHRLVLGEFSCHRFRISATEVESVCFRQRAIAHR